MLAILCTAAYAFAVGHAATTGLTTKPGDTTSSACGVRDASSTIVASSLQPFCTTYLGYNSATRTTYQSMAVATSTSTFIITTTQITLQTTTRTLNGTKNADATVPGGPNQNKRGVATSSTEDIPPALTQCDTSIISSACSIAAPPPKSTPVTTIFISYTSTATKTTTATVSATSTVTISVLPPFAKTCTKPSSCGKVNLCNDSRGFRGACVCYKTVEDINICSNNVSCGQACDVSTDCGDGYFCVRDTCCGETGKVCMAVGSVQYCDNARTPFNMFRRAQSKDGTLALGEDPLFFDLE